MHISTVRAAISPGPTTTKPDLEDVRDVRPKALRPHKVIVLDCNCHTFDDVEIALCRVIPGMTRAKAHQHAWEIHTTGASVVTSTGNNTKLSISCGTGKVAVGGGGMARGNNNRLVASYPSINGTAATAGQTPTGWTAEFENSNAANAVYGVCANCPQIA